jgi:hypothetical protein
MREPRNSHAARGPRALQSKGICNILILLTVFALHPISLHSLQTNSGPSSAGIPTNTAVPPPQNGSAGGAVRARTFLSDFEFWLSAEILIFGFGVIAVEYLLLKKARLTAEEALRVYAVTLIIVGTLFAITAGFDSTQIAPAMGLFGTIAGYLLGRRAVPAARGEPAEEDNGK